MLPVAQKKATVDVQQEKEVFLKARQYFFDANQQWTSGQVRAMPEILEQLIRRLPTKKVSNLKDVFNFF